VVYDFSRAKARLAAKTSAGPADRTGFTDEARELARARESVSEAPDVRADRVEALKAQIARGDYKPDPEEIAKKILERGL
jgi:negative regulator of flagellin synthesis FlgM